MISLDANGHAWRRCMCGAIECGHDYDEASVREFFDRAAAWAREKTVPFDRKTDHAAIYLASRDRPGEEPVIPEHVRRYCAEKADLELVVSNPDLLTATALPAPSLSAASGQPRRFRRRNGQMTRPSVAMRQ